MHRSTPALCYPQQNLNYTHIWETLGVQQLDICPLEGETGLPNEKPSEPTRNRVPGTVVGPATQSEAGGGGRLVLSRVG